MKAILLAAGRGTRISRYLDGNPKMYCGFGKWHKADRVFDCNA